MAKTLTYSSSVEGWPSFYSFIPERMLGMNNRFYSFNGGNLWIHNSDDVDRNNFYGNSSVSRIEGIINDSPHEIKTYKTFVLEGTHPWDTTIETDLSTGEIQSSWYKLKEGDYFGHIRRTQGEEDVDMRSAIGIGTVDGIESSNPASVDLDFTFNIDSMLSVGDKLYINNGGVAQYSGDIINIGTNDIFIDTTNGGVIPSKNDFVLVIKNSVAESYGSTGYFLRYTIENGSTEFVEIFSIGSNLFKSYP